ncbi:MAG: efflux RND transporter periplasmic adaptor subunit [Acidobacteriota bacterium]
MDIRRDDAPRRKRRFITRSAAAVVLVASGALALCHLKPAAPSLSAASAWIDTVKRGTLRVQLRGSGLLTPEEVRWIPATTDGRIDRVLIQPGSVVHADSVILVVTNPELQQAGHDAELQLRAAEAELRNRRLQIESQLLSQEAVSAAARADYEEARLRATADGELAAAGLTSQLTWKFSKGREGQLAVRVDVEERRLQLGRESQSADLATVAVKVDQLRALLALKRQQIDALQVRAGREGVLQQVAVEVGQPVTAGATLAKVADPQSLKASIHVSEVQASQIALGQAVDVDTHNGVVPGVVARIDPTVQNNSVTVDVRLPRDLPPGARPDLSVDAVINVDRVDDTLFVGRPVQAEANGAVALFRLAADGRSATRIRVRIGHASWNSIEIREGLAAGDRVILSDMSAFDRFDRIAIGN